MTHRAHACEPDPAPSEDNWSQPLSPEDIAMLEALGDGPSPAGSLDIPPSWIPEPDFPVEAPELDDREVGWALAELHAAELRAELSDLSRQMLDLRATNVSLRVENVMLQRTLADQATALAGLRQALAAVAMAPLSDPDASPDPDPEE